MKKGTAVLLVELAVLATPALAKTWDLAADFSSAGNPDGPWQYGYRDASGVFQLMTYAGPDYYGFVRWCPASGLGEDTVAVGQNDNSVTVFGVAPGHVSLESDWVIPPEVRWVAPTAGIYDIAIAVGGTTDFTGIGWGNKNAYTAHVEIGGTDIACTSLLQDPNNDLKSWTLTGVSLNAGDILDAWVPVNPVIFGGNTDTTITVSNGAVPEPVTLLTMCVGALGLGIGRRRRSGKSRLVAQ